MPPPASLKTKTKTKTARRTTRRPVPSRRVSASPVAAAEAMCAHVNAVVAEFALLSAWEKAATVESFQARIRRICTDPRRMPDDSALNRQVLRAATHELERRRERLAELDD